MLKYLLDTNFVLYVIKRRPIELLSTFNRHQGQMAISSITLAELVYGAEKSVKTEQNLSQIEDFVSRITVIDYGAKAAAHCGDIKASLEKQGLVIGVNDLHIAAHARSEGLIVVTNKLPEFKSVEGIRTENWV